ncbi:MAG: hypothetical protein KKG59_01765, partial [Nanoarchaeota archaeon]|nr:hypothetical protein [Nanoarchaeota archaeon]
PRVLWVGIDKSKDLYALRRAVDNVIYCHEPDSAVHDQFKGHITLARIKSIDDLEKFKATVENVDVDSHIIPVQEFVLMKSELLNTGPKYVVLARFKAKTA